MFFGTNPYPSIALLIKYSAFKEYEIKNTFIEPLEQQGIPASDVVAISLDYNQANKIPVSFIKEYLADLLPELEALKVKTLYVADAAYFKVLTGVTKTDPHLGYVVPCAVKGFTHFQVILGINHHSLIYNPMNEEKLRFSLDCLINHYENRPPLFENTFLKAAHYPDTYTEVKEALNTLHGYPELFVDIEAFSLKKVYAGIGTIAFAWNKHEGIAFCCDYSTVKHPEHPEIKGAYVPNTPIRDLLKEFFTHYQGAMHWHGGNYDIGVIIATLWMTSYDDYVGLNTGLHIMCPKDRWGDTRLIAYLALNTCSKMEYNLKSLVHSYAGNYAVDVTDITKQPKDDLLKYNLIDAVCTAWVKETYWPKVLQEQQQKIYSELFMPSQKTIIQMELVGLPIYPAEVKNLKDQLQVILNSAEKTIQEHPGYKEATYQYRCNLASTANKKLKKLRKTEEDFVDTNLNINSKPQMALLLYKVLGLPVLETTATGAPSASRKVINKLRDFTDDPEISKILEALYEYSEATKIFTSFIPAFEKAPKLTDSIALLQGSFILGGTKSGRCSSNSPNMQQLPSGSKFGKPVKKCFGGFKDWLLVGADYNALEARINALLTKDPNKLAVYTEGYDSHCFNTYSYWPEKMPDIVKTVESINSIQEKYSKLRSKSKTITFAAQYGGTFKTFMNSGGFSEKEAKQIEANFKETYKVSEQWLDAVLDTVIEKGYAELAFGLRLKAPLLGKTLKGLSKGGAIASEARTIGNAVSGQSYGLLTNRTMNAFMDAVWEHPEMSLKVLPVAMIHDALYFLVKSEAHVVEWVNNTLIKEMQWQDLPEIQHDQVKLGANLDIYWPTWANPLTLPNNISIEEIVRLTQEHKQKIQEQQHAQT